MNSNDENLNPGNYPPENQNSVPGSPNASAADLIREVLRQSRMGSQNAPSSYGATPQTPPVGAAGFSPRGEVVADAVKRVLQQVRNGETSNLSAPPIAPPVYPPASAAPPIAPPVYPPQSAVPPVAPPVYPSENAAPPIAPPVYPQENADASSAHASEVKPRVRRKKKSRGTTAPEASATALGALVGVVATTASAASPDEFLSSTALNVGSGPRQTFSLNSLAVRKESETNFSDSAFLNKLREKSAPEDGSSADTRELLQERSTLDRAAKDAPMWLASLVFHLILVVLLALIVMKTDLRKAFEVVSEPGFSDEVVIDEVFDPDAAVDASPTELDSTPLDVKSDVVADVPDVSTFNEENSQALSLVDDSVGTEAALVGDVENLLGTLNGDDLSGRGKNKAAMLIAGGGSEGSEKSVALALSWLANHQLPDGSWSFNTNVCPSCRGQCTHSGTKDAPIAATSMALLPFLAAGNTPTKGKYKKVVAAGLNYLTTSGKDTENGISYHEPGGNMYSHGLAAITLCETYAMLASRERARYYELGKIAQAAIDYVEYAQAQDGGWRYTPHQAGDTSVAGWQLMALKSGQLAGLEVSDSTILNARDFLRDVVSKEYETRYAYQRDGSESPATDSIGLLCRLYLDWGIENPSLVEGVNYVSNTFGPQLNNPYYTYYATQLMYNVGGEVWSKWNGYVRDALIKSQVMEGHERGSWFPADADSHAATGGRLYVTSLNCMVLEVYYRHMPLYQKLERNTNFPIETPIANPE